MKRTLSQVTLDCLLAFYLNSAEQADKVLAANLDKVSAKNRKTLEKVLERSQDMKERYWHAIADELQRIALADDLNVEIIAPKPLVQARQALKQEKPFIFGVSQ